MTSNPLIGVGLRHPHHDEVLEKRPPIGWFEVHSENFFERGGPSLQSLVDVAEHYPLSFHGVGLSLGSAEGIALDHLKRLQKLINHVSPFLLSEHLSWGHVGGVHMHDLLPVPYTTESMATFEQNIHKAQDFLKRELLIENPSSYLEYASSHLDEADFLVELCQKTGAKLLLDINNIFVSQCNHGWDAKAYIDKIPEGLVGEMHLAGHSEKTLASGKVLHIDTHDDYVREEVWDLYAYAIQKLGPVYTLLEWDAKIPALETLMGEAFKAEKYLPAFKEAS